MILSALLTGAISTTALTTFAATPKNGQTCKVVGQQTTVKKQVLRCTKVGSRKLWRLVPTKPSSSPSPTPSATYVTAATSPKAYSECQIRDARTRIIQREAIAFPIPRAETPSRGTMKVALVPIDFDDLPGTASPLAQMEKIKSTTDEFARWFSRDRLRFEWVMPTTWIRAGSNSEDFDWKHPASNDGNTPGFSSQNDIGQRLVAAADRELNLSGINAFYFIYPDGSLKIKDGINFRASFNTGEGRIFAGVYADSAWLRNSKTDPAMWLMHEHMHGFGYIGHSPAYPMAFSIAHNQSGPSKVFNMWDRLVLDWVADGDLYCTTLDALSGEYVQLVPQESEKKGFQGAAIVLDSHTMLVIELHRKDKWVTDYYPTLLEGVTVMLVDTTRDTDRSGEYTDDDYIGTKYSRTATYLMTGSELRGQVQIPNTMPVDLRYIMRPGDRYIFENVEVTYLNTSGRDLIRIARK